MRRLSVLFTANLDHPAGFIWLVTRDYQGKRVNPPFFFTVVLVLDMVPSSFDDVTRTMKGQLKRLSRNL